MAHYAHIDENNIVYDITKGLDETEMIDGKSPEQWYSEFLGERLVRCSYNTWRNTHKLGGTPFRGNYPEQGFYFDEEKDVFIPPQPWASWILNDEIADWEPPVIYPNDEKEYRWDEATISWVEITPEAE